VTAGPGLEITPARMRDLAAQAEALAAAITEAQEDFRAVSTDFARSYRRARSQPAGARSRS
jgi:hypothetical protein